MEVTGGPPSVIRSGTGLAGPSRAGAMAVLGAATALEYCLQAVGCAPWLSPGTRHPWSGSPVERISCGALPRGYAERSPSLPLHLWGVLHHPHSQEQAHLSAAVDCPLGSVKIVPCSVPVRQEAAPLSAPADRAEAETLRPSDGSPCRLRGGTSFWWSRSSTALCPSSQHSHRRCALQPIW
jgi:hypothetical protein